jgi:hypothetical protein
MNVSMPTSKRLLVLAALLSVIVSLGLVFAPQLEAAPICNSYGDSSSTFFWDYGWACAYSGPSCQECVEVVPGGYRVCVTSGDRPICYEYYY